MPRTTKIINTIDGVDFDADNYSADVYDLIVQSYEIVQNLVGVNSITIEVQTTSGAAETHTFKKSGDVTVKPEGVELNLVQ